MESKPFLRVVIKTKNKRLKSTKKGKNVKELSLRMQVSTKSKRQVCNFKMMRPLDNTMLISLMLNSIVTSLSTALMSITLMNFD